MVGGLEGIRSRAGSQQAGMPGKKVFEAEVGGEVSFGCSDAAVIFRTVASQQQRRGLLHPLETFGVKAPQIPLCADEVSAVRVDLLCRKRCDLGRPISE